MPRDQDVLFQGFSEVQKLAFLELATPAHFAVRAEMLKEGELGNDMLLLREGIASVWVRDVKINEVGADSILGISALVEPHGRTASLIAETQVETLRFTRAAVLGHLEAASLKLFHQFFVNAFRIHMNLVRQCEERIVKLARELDEL